MSKGRAGNACKVNVTPAMVVAGAGVLYELAGEVSKEALARAVFEATAAADEAPRDSESLRVDPINS
jgi:hypothetical protein